MTQTPSPEFANGFALVAGGSGGLGAAVVEELARRGSDVALTYSTNRDAAEAVAERVRAAGCKALVGQVDLRDPEAIDAFTKEAVAQLGRLHSVVYAAGPAFNFAYINAIQPAEWAQTMRTDVEGCFNLVWATLPHVKAGGGGNYVAVITGAADRPPPKDIMSAAPKAAIQCLMRGLAREEGRFNIRANCVGPGWIAAGLGAHYLDNDEHASYVRKFTAQIPLQKAGEASDVADAVVFFLSEQSRYISGASLPVAGGLQL
ncbi:SDR family NAD(P)-dependent oxidoreductase [Sphingopyxis sp.]|jgi:NAD(P)-dependent dehydrogenase (short-subunit alcohol dehydrogenase family)|uniref:SDR family NAD(P)-dependent oxidoreductase n=1 Tax=Sphingopyxis sp. TaxID=1908224 RepID=UPI003F72A3F7